MFRQIFAVLFLALLQTAPAEIYEGQVLIKNPGLLVVKGTNWANWVETWALTNHPPLSEGDNVRISGKQKPDKDCPDRTRIRASKIVVLGHGPLPEDIDVSGDQITNGSLDFTFVRAVGTVESVIRGNQTWNWAILRTEKGSFGVSIRDEQHNYASLRKLVDATVSVRGIVVYSLGSTTHLGAHLSLRGQNALKVITSAPKDPFAADHFSKTTLAHRQTLHGIVLARSQNCIMVQSDDFGTVRAIPALESDRPDVGHAVTLAGFAHYDPVRLLFTEALFRDEGRREFSFGKPVSLENVTSRLLNSHGQFVRIEGTLKSVTAQSDKAIEFVIETMGTPITVNLTSILPPLDLLPPHGSILRVDGILVVDHEDPSPVNAFPRLRGVSIIPRAASDITVVRRPPWLTITKIAIGLVVFMSIVLLRVCLSRAATKLKLRERTSLAIDVHDSLAQFLTGVSLKIDAAELAEQTGDRKLARTHIICARKAMKACRENLRYCLGDLRTNPFTKDSLNDIIRESIQPYIGATKMAVRFNVPRRHFTDRLLHTLVSILRELAVNAVRHGHANLVLIAGEWRDGSIRASVRDNGCGFDPQHCQGPADGHYGLQGVRERLAAYRGSLTIKSKQNKGSKLTFTLIT